MKPRLSSESAINWFADSPSLWAEDTEDDDDVFMPTRTAKRAAASKGKRGATSKGKSALPSRKSDDDDDAFMPSSTSKRAAASKGKRAATSKGKSAPSTEAGGCVDGR